MYVNFLQIFLQIIGKVNKKGIKRDRIEFEGKKKVCLETYNEVL